MSNRISLFLSESVQSTFRAFAFTHILFSVGSISLATEIKQTFHSRDQLNKQKAASQCDTIYNFADRVPEFPGGEDSLFYFISHNLGLPFLKEKTTDTENVICSVTITQEGEVTKAEVIRSLEPEFDEEALRIIRSMPDWIPGQKAGQNICMRHIIIVPFPYNRPDYSKIFEQDSSENWGCYLFMELPPIFKQGGEQGITEFIYSNLKYPEAALKEKKEGRVICTFIIGTNGQVSDPRILRSSDSVFNEEVLRIINLMPQWIPGVQFGKPVRMRYTVPVNFRLPTSGKSK